MSIGVVYVAVGEKFINEARISASSLKEKMPELSVTIFADETIKAKCFDACEVMTSSRNGYLDKIFGIANSPYDRTLFLDTDTYVHDEFWELFSLLEKYDIGAALSEERVGENLFGESYDYQKLKDSNGIFIYPIYNSGVILYKKSERVRQFISDWLALARREMQEKGKDYGDQPAFQTVLHNSDLREVVLSPEYNCRFLFPIGLSGRVKIFHGRAPSMSKIAGEINATIGTRIFHPRWGLIPGRKRDLIRKALADKLGARFGKVSWYYKE